MNSGNIDSLSPAKVYLGLEQMFEDAVVLDDQMEGHRIIHLVDQAGRLATVERIGGPSSGRDRHRIITRAPWGRHHKDTTTLLEFAGTDVADDYKTEVRDVYPGSRFDEHEMHGAHPVVQPKLAYLTASRVICARVLDPEAGRNLLVAEQRSFAKAREFGFELYGRKVFEEVTAELLTTFAHITQPHIA